MPPPERFDERCLGDDRATRRVDEQRAGLHALELGTGDEPGGFGVQPAVDRNDVRLLEQPVEGNPPRSRLRGPLVGEGLARGQDVHVESPSNAGHLGADASQADYAQGPPLQQHAHRRRPGAFAHALGHLRDLSCQRQQQREGQFHRGGAGIVGGHRHDDAAARGLRHIQVRYAAADLGDEAKRRRQGELALPERRTLAHEHHRMGVAHRRRPFLIGGELALHHLDVGQPGRFLVSRHRRTEPLVVVQHHHAKPIVRHDPSRPRARSPDPVFLPSIFAIS